MGFSKFIVITLLAATFIASVEPHGDCSFNYTSYEGSQRKYNVILKDRMAAKSHFEWLANCCDKSVKHISNVDFSKHDIEESDAHDFSVKDALYGYSTYFDPKFVKKHLKHNDDVELAEEDVEFSTTRRHHYNNHHIRTSVRKNPTPNLDRIDQKTFPLDGKYKFPASAGKGVTMYIVDTGILVDHNEFEGRAVHGGSFCLGCPDTDDNGHGTHVAAISGGKTFGVANRVKLVAVKVLDAEGNGSTASVIAGLTFVLSEHQADQKKKSVINMSLGGDFDEVTNAVVKKLTDNGVHVVVSAGNESRDACLNSPASEKTAITVGATENDSDDLTDFSNFGECVDIFAPGREILSAGIESNDDTQIFSGTSQASPHVAGTVALIISEFGNSPVEEMAKTLNKFATKGVILEDTLKGSPNVFLRVPFSKYNKHHKPTNNHH